MQSLCQTCRPARWGVAKVDGTGVCISCEDKTGYLILRMCVVWETLPLPVLEHGNFSNEGFLTPCRNLSVVSSVRFMFSLPQTTFGSLLLFAWSLCFLGLQKLLTCLKVSPGTAAKLSPAPWSYFQAQGRKRSAGLTELPWSFLQLILGLSDVSTVVSSWGFFKSQCLDYLFAKDPLRCRSQLFLCSSAAFQMSPNQSFGLGTKQAFPGRNARVCGHGAGSCIPAPTPGKRLCWAGGLLWAGTLTIFCHFVNNKRANAGL